VLVLEAGGHGYDDKSIPLLAMIDEQKLHLLRTQYQEIGTNFRTVWDFYLKFYIAFMALNFTALGLVIQHMSQDRRWPMILSFALQNILSAGTAIGVALYSQHATNQQQRIIDVFRTDSMSQAETPPEFQSPIPTKLAKWGAYANALSQFLFIVCWVVAWFVGDVKAR